MCCFDESRLEIKGGCESFDDLLDFFRHGFHIEIFGEFEIVLFKNFADPISGSTASRVKMTEAALFVKFGCKLRSCLYSGREKKTERDTRYKREP